jgi:glycogen debranching enzyme
MTAEDMKRWGSFPLQRRQQIIASFYQSSDDASMKRILSLVRAPGGFGVYASCGPNYQFAVFGRDSIAVARELLPFEPRLTREIILLLAHLQGLKLNAITEEETGKIHHEYRATHFNGDTISPAARKVLATLRPLWGGSADELCYYGTVDATPLFISLVRDYCDKYGTDLLDTVVTGRDGQKRPLRWHVHIAVQWLAGRILNSPWQLLEFKRLNQSGLPYQAWKDSESAYLHADGSHANADGGIASLEVQGLAFDALLAADFVAENSNEAKAWQDLAETVRRQTLDRLWMEKEQFFAMGLDRDDQGTTRQIATLNANAAMLLDSGLLRPTDRRYVKPVVDKLLSEDFLTDVGIRARALSHAKLLSFADYHGSLVSWPHETFAFAKGLRRQGFADQADQLEHSLAQAVARAGEFYEFFLVRADGAVKYHYRQENPDEPTFHAIGAANLPEPGQAWTISAIAAIARGRPNLIQPAQLLRSRVQKIPVLVS